MRFAGIQGLHDYPDGFFWPSAAPPDMVFPELKMKQKKKIAVVPGDGIGKEVIAAALRVIRAVKAPVEMTEFDWSADRYLKDGIAIVISYPARLGQWCAARC